MLRFAVPGYSAPHSENITLSKPLMLSIKLLLQCESWPEIQESLYSRTLGIFIHSSKFQGFLSIYL